MSAHADTDMQAVLIAATGTDCFRMLVEHSHDFFALADPDLSITYVNPAGRELIGVGLREELSGLNLAHILADAKQGHYQQFVLPSILQRGLWQGESALRGPHGETIPVLMRSFVIRDQHSALPVAIATIMHSLAERLNTEEALHRRIEMEKLVASISQGFIHCGADAMAFQVSVTLELLGSFVAAERSALLLATAEGQQFDVVSEWNVEPLPPLSDTFSHFSTAEFQWSWSRLLDGDVVALSNADVLPPHATGERRLFAEIGVRSLLIVPLVSESRSVGCIAFARHATARDWAVADINLLRTVADIIANALARHTMERDLRRSEQKFAQIFASIPDAVTVSDIADGRYVEVNPAFERISGFKRNEVLGRTSLELGIWIDPGMRAKIVDTVMHHGQISEVETRFRRRSGEEMDGLVSAFRVQVGERDCVVAITRDVTDSKSMETALRRSEYVLRAIVDNIPDAVWMKDDDGRFIVGNDSLAAFFGRESLSEILGRKVSELLPEVPAKRLRDDDAIVARTRSQLTQEESYELRGETRWYETVKSPVLDPSGKLVGTTGISHNVTQRKLFEQALRQSEARFRQFAEDLPFFIWMASVDRRRVIFANRSYERIFGRSLESLKEDPTDWSRSVHPDDRAQMPSVASFADRRDLYVDEFRICRPDGVVRWIRNHVIPLLDERGRPYLHAGITEDITERKTAEDQVRSLNAELEERVEQRTAELQASLEELRSFSYSVSHDLRTPLRGINGFSHLLMEEYGAHLDEVATGYLKRIRSATERMGILIDQLLRLAQLSRAEIRPEELDLSRIAAEIVAELRSQDPHRTVSVDISAGLCALGDPVLVPLLMQNLIGNAWKFTARRVPARIEIGARTQDGRSEFFVRDNGVGFDNAFADKLFRPFQRLHGVEEYPGSGIGLATVKRIVERHGGQVRAAGSPGDGASFHFTLP